MSGLVDEVKRELWDIKHSPECPACGSKILYGTWTRVFRLDLKANTSEIVTESGVLLDVYCECGWDINSYEAPTREEDRR